MSEDPHPTPEFWGRPPEEREPQLAAEVRPPLTAPHPDHGGFAIPAHYADVLEAARQAWRTAAGAQQAFNDPVLQSCRPALMRLDDALTGEIRQRLGDDGLMDLFEEVRSYLPHLRHRRRS